MWEKFGLDWRMWKKDHDEYIKLSKEYDKYVEAGDNDNQCYDKMVMQTLGTEAVSFGKAEDLLNKIVRTNSEACTEVSLRRVGGRVKREISFLIYAGWNGKDGKIIE